MKTNQLMKRDFNGTKITQRTKDSFFSATELLKYYNEHNRRKRLYKKYRENYIYMKDKLRSDLIEYIVAPMEMYARYYDTIKAILPDLLPTISYKKWRERNRVSKVKDRIEGGERIYPHIP